MLNTDVSGRFSRREWLMLLAAFVVIALSRFLFWERSFWEWDDIMFAQGLHHYNVVEHTPHPPGYPVYIALGRGVNYFLHNDLHALIFLNAFFGSAITFPLYFFYRGFAPPRVAGWATLLSLFNWIFWVYSETAMSDVTSAFWIITSLALLYRYESNRCFFLGMVSLGLAIGVSPQRMVFGVLLVPWLLWQKVRRGELRAAGIGLGLLAGTCLAWFVPMVLATGGLQAYWGTLSRHGRETAAYNPGYLVMRHRMSLAEFTRTKFVLMWGDPYFTLLILALAIFGGWRYGSHRRWASILLLALTFTPWLVVDFLSLNVYYARYQMFTVVLLAFFIAYGLLQDGPRFPAGQKFLAPAALLGLILFSAFWTLPMVLYLRDNDSIAVQLFAYIRQHLDAKTDALVCDPQLGLFPRQYLPDFTMVYMDDVNEKAHRRVIQDMDWYYIGTPLAGRADAVSFHCDNERIQPLAVYQELSLHKMDVLFSNDYKLDWTDAGPFYALEKNAAHCYLKNTDRSKLLVLEGTLVSPGQKPAPIRLELNGRPLDAAVVPPGRFDRFFPVAMPGDLQSQFQTLTVRMDPYAPGARLRLEAVRWLDVELPAAPQVQVIDFKPGDEPLMLAGWSGLESEGGVTFAWSDGDYSALRVALQPRGIYELSFRAWPVPRDESSAPPQTVTICLGEVCSPAIELSPHDWQTYTHLLFVPAARAGENVGLTFHYAFTHSPTFPDGSQDARALGVAFDYIKIKLLGTRPAAASDRLER